MVEVRAEMPGQGYFALYCEEGRDVLASSIFCKSLTNGWDFYPETEDQPRLLNCCSLGNLVFKFYLVIDFNSTYLRRLEAY